MSMLAPGNILISLCAAGSLGYLFFKVRAPFKSHSFNTFAYIILLLIVYALIGKLTQLLFISFSNYLTLSNHVYFIVRIFYFFVDMPKNENPKIVAFLATYPQINFVICSYLLSN